MTSPRRVFARRFLSALCFILFLSTGAAFAQTSIVTYQGRLTDGGTPPTGVFDMQFKLYDTATVGTGTLQGSPNTVTNATVNVVIGIFTVQLDFGASGFPGADRYLEISVRHPGDPTYTTLAPRQQFTSTPYSIRAASAPASGLTGTTLASGVTGSSLTSVGTLSNLTVTNPIAGSVTGNAANVTGTVALANGGTGATSAANARTNLGLGTLAIVSPTGTANATTFLRGDNSWAAVSGGGGTTIFAARTTATTVNSSTFVDVITVSLEANKTYFFDGAVYGQRVGATNGNANLRITYTGSATTDIGVDVIGATLLGTVFNSTSFDFEALANGSTNGFGASVQKEFPVSGYIKTTSAGTLALSVARGALNTTVDLNVREGTYLRATPVN